VALHFAVLNRFVVQIRVQFDRLVCRCTVLVLLTNQQLPVCSLKPAFHDSDIDTNTDTDSSTSLRPTRAISWSYSCDKLNEEVDRHADILATILARMSARMSVSVSWNARLIQHANTLNIYASVTLQTMVFTTRQCTDFSTTFTFY